MAYTVEQRERAIAAYHATGSGYTAAAEIGASYETVYKWLRHAGITGKSPRIADSEEKIARLIERYQSNEPVNAMCSAEHIDKGRMQRLLRARGIPKRQDIRHVPLQVGLLTWDEIMAPGPGAWDIDERIRVSEARNAAIAADIAARHEAVAA